MPHAQPGRSSTRARAHRASCFFIEEVLSPWTLGPRGDPNSALPAREQQPPEYPGCVRAEVPSQEGGHKGILSQLHKESYPQNLQNPFLNLLGSGLR